VSNVIANRMHWNTDKLDTVMPLPQSIVEATREYFKNYPDKKELKIMGFDELTFTREDVGVDGQEPVSLLAWLINTGKINTDLGSTIFKDPFIYSDGVDAKTAYTPTK